MREMPKPNGGGGGTLERVGFLRRDSACSDKSPILRRGLAHYRLDKSLRPRLESGDFSSTILESQSSSENHKTRRSRSFFRNLVFKVSLN